MKRWLSALLLGVALAAPAPAEETLAEKGYRILLNQPLGQPLLTEEQLGRLWEVWPEPLRSQAAAANEAQRLELLLRRYGFQLSPDRPGSPLPQQFTRDEQGRLYANCLSCHGGPVRGKVILGLGNHLGDFDLLGEDLVKSGGALPMASPPVPLPPEPAIPVRGLSQAWGTAMLFLSVRDKDLNLVPRQEFPLTEAELDIPLRTPAFWLSKRKRRYYADGFVGKTHRDIMQFSLQYKYSGEQFRALEEKFEAIFAWINSLPAPAWPGTVDRALASQGQLIYASECLRCHGQGAQYPEKLVALTEIGTDPLRAQMSPAFKKHLGAGWLGSYGQTPLDLAKGYVAPPLDGVWATAPYLHNGSVPTLWHLLTPEARPKLWTRTDDGYDTVRVGVEATAAEQVPAGEERRYYRTSLKGLGNQGHRFPPGGLAEDEKRALLEFLKTL